MPRAAEQLHWHEQWTAEPRRAKEQQRSAAAGCGGAVGGLVQQWPRPIWSAVGMMWAMGRTGVKTAAAARRWLEGQSALPHSRDSPGVAAWHGQQSVWAPRDVPSCYAGGLGALCLPQGC